MNYNDHGVDTGRRLYYSSSQGPFYNANNIFMFYGGGNRGGIVENVLRALGNHEPVVHVHGEQGSGKTMLSLVIGDRIKHRFHTMRYDLTELSAAKLLRHLLIELVPHSAELLEPDKMCGSGDTLFVDKAITCIENQLRRVRKSSNNKPYILFVDSKGSLDSETLDVIKRLSAFRSSDAPMFYCVVFHPVAGYAEGCAAAIENSRQSRNHYWLRRLTLTEINEYLRHHMMLFDFNRRDLFTRDMAYTIAEHSEGVFESINTLARNAFSVANREDSGTTSNSRLLVTEPAAADESMDTPAMLVRYRCMAMAAMGSSLLLCVAFLLFLIK